MRTFLSVFFLFVGFELVAHTQRAYIAPSSMYRAYEEDVSKGQCKEQGWLYGFQAGYDRIASNSIYLGADLRNYWGKSRYIGALKNTMTGDVASFYSHTDNWIIQAEGRMGYTLYASGWKWASFLGLGYFQWNREPVERTYGYDEIYSWLYYSAGFRIDKRITTLYKVGLLCKAMYLQNAQLEVKNLFAFPIKVKLGNTFQYEGAFLFTIRCSNHCDTSLVAMGSYQPVGASQKQKVGSATFFEPSSSSWQVGGRFELGYLF